MTGSPDDLPGGLVRQESRPVDGPVALDLAVDVGRVLVHLDPASDPGASDTPEVRLEVRHDPAAAGGWAQRIGEVASWLGTVGAGPPPITRSAARSASRSMGSSAAPT